MKPGTIHALAGLLGVVSVVATIVFMAFGWFAAVVLADDQQ